MMNGLPEKLQQLIDIAYKNSERLLLLINDMLDIDKIVSGHMQFDIREEPLFALISQAIEANRPYADKFGVSVTARDFDPDIMIKVDAGRFLQILANLISNAAKFSNQGGAVEIFTSLSLGKLPKHAKEKPRHRWRGFFMGKNSNIRLIPHSNVGGKSSAKSLKKWWTL